VSEECEPVAGKPTIDPDTGRRFRLPIFEGPLDLLLHLIKRNELDPHEVTTSIITEQYLEYIEMLDALNLDVAGEYLVMAATLLLIKSFSLLPHPNVEDAEESEELKGSLVARLLEFQRYREAAEKLAARSILGRDVFSAPGEKIEEAGQAPTYRVTLFDLVEALRLVLKRTAAQTPRAIALRDIPIAQCVPVILEALGRTGSLEFGALFEDLHDRPLVVATFLALLELIRRGLVRARQEHCFGAIWLDSVAGEQTTSAGA
jgi:segregation and condensation protein A